jgi:hypothetical protein
MRETDGSASVLDAIERAREAQRRFDEREGTQLQFDLTNAPRDDTLESDSNPMEGSSNDNQR